MFKPNSLEDLIQANGAVVSSDVHGDYKLISNSLEYANNNNLAYIVNGDIVNDYQFSQLANELGYKFNSQLQTEYFEQNLDNSDLETLGLVQILSQYGPEQLMSQVPEEQKQQFQSKLEQEIQKYQSQEFQQTLQKVHENFILEKQDELKENQIQLRALYEVFMDKEAKRFADELNKYSDVDVAINLGNHENAFFVEQVRNYLTNKDQITNLTNHQGHYKIKQDNGEVLSMVGMTNCSQFMPYLNEVLSPDEMMQYYSHMGIDEHKQNSILSGNVDISKLDELVEHYSKDFDYAKTKAKGEGNADVFVTHGQVGITGNMYEVPYFASALKLSLESQLTIEGHIHKKFDGKNAYGKDMIRAVGNDVAVIQKENGKVTHKWVNVSDSYTNGHSNEIPYDLDELKQSVEELIEKYNLRNNKAA